MLPSKLYGTITNYFKGTPPKEADNSQAGENQNIDLKQKLDKKENTSTFLQTSGCSYHLENIIREAKTDLYLVSPFLKINDRLFDLLKSFQDKIHIHILYGKERRQDGTKKLKEFENCTVYYLQNLHAKCYLNEEAALITSMNLYDFSQINNVEFGMIINKVSKPEEFDQIQAEVIRLIKIAEIIDIKDKPKKYGLKTVKEENETKTITYKKEPCTPKVKKKFTGYCIRCNREIDYNPDNPYCYECWNSWNYFGNADFQEKHCHRCGNKEPSTMNKPQCYDCYTIWRAENCW